LNGFGFLTGHCLIVLVEPNVGRCSRFPSRRPLARSLPGFRGCIVGADSRASSSSRAGPVPPRLDIAARPDAARGALGTARGDIVLALRILRPVLGESLGDQPSGEDGQGMLNVYRFTLTMPASVNPTGLVDPEVHGSIRPSSPKQNRSMIAVGTMRSASPVAVRRCGKTTRDGIYDRGGVRLSFDEV
jgi:hypothetical protein